MAVTRTQAFAAALLLGAVAGACFEPQSETCASGIVCPGGSACTADGTGGQRPPGGIDHAGDREPDYRQKSAEHFKRRALKANTLRDFEAILTEARAALEAWRRPPKPTEPLPGDPLFKRHVAESAKTAPELARLYGISARTVHRWRRKYATNTGADSPLDKRR